MISVLCLLLAAGCETVGTPMVSLNPRFQTFSIRRVAILPFEGVPVTKEVEEYQGWWRHSIVNNGQVVSDVFTTEMMRIPAYDYVERSQIQKILQEQNVSLTDLMREKSASEIGKLLGADAVVLGTVNKFDYGFNFINMKQCVVSFSVRMVDTNTGTVLWSATVNCQEGHTQIMKVTQRESARIVDEIKAKLLPPK